ncbi:MAG: DNA polymerase III subunit beta [Candidatus Peribacteraceae bacterium]|nr:DNA polymerase III subunit beta [Candidatus Peribacteraceae bacterium]
MKFSCKTADFLQALQLVSRAISGQQALPILNNVLLEVEGKHCTVSATDLELSIVTHFEANIENEGAITIPAKAILNFAQYNTDGNVLLETSEGTQLKCTSKHAKTLIAGEASGEFPTISRIEKETTLTLESAPLLEALHKVTFASAKSTLRPVLSGVYVRTEKGKLILVATDSYRLSEYCVEANVGEADVSCIIPTKVLEELKMILGGRKGDKEEEDGKKKKPQQVSISLSSQQIEMTIGNTRLLSRLIEGKFPDYQQIIPREAATRAFLTTKELLTVVKRMHYFAKEINNNLTLTFSTKGVHITTPQTQAGKDETTLDAEVKGKENKIALSSSYLLDFLGHVEDEKVEVHLTDSMHPAVFHLPSNPLSLHLIMPLRIQEE